jgi:hypothetical protein
LITLIPAVLKAVPSSIPVLAAGGLSNGAHLASVLTLGASGAAIGTRFLFTPESVFSDKKKQTLLRASVASTVRSSAFDEVTESAWPKGVDARGLRNEVVEDEVQGLGLDERKKRWKAGADGSHEIIFSGSSVGLVNEIMPAAVSIRPRLLSHRRSRLIYSLQDIVREIHSDAVKSLQTAFDLLAESVRTTHSLCTTTPHLYFSSYLIKTVRSGDQLAIPRKSEVSLMFDLHQQITLIETISFVHENTRNVSRDGGRHGAFHLSMENVQNSAREIISTISVPSSRFVRTKRHLSSPLVLP